MSRPERSARIATRILAAIFIVIVAVSVINRAEHTFRYPDYSSLNNSDLGLKAYHDALDRLGLATARNYRPIEKLRQPIAAIVQAGKALTSLQTASDKDLGALESVASNNGRLILLLVSDDVIEVPSLEKKDQSKQPVEKSKDDLQSRWGLELGFRFVKAEGTGKSNAVKFRERFVPIVWYVKSWDKNWKAWTQEYSGASVLERRFGQGTMLLVPGAKHFTNRQLLTHPESKLLADVLGPYQSIVFDESHLGLQDTGTVAGLAKTHNLQWLLVGLLVLAVLYVWRSSVSFLPPPEAGSEAQPSLADTHRALSNLLIQSVAPAQLLQRALAEWNGSASLISRAKRKINDDELAQASRSAPHSKAMAAASGYNRIAQLLRARTRLTP